MPTYEYICTNKECEHLWEIEQKMSDKHIDICPECEKETAKRLISKSSFQLKGGGWYKDLYSKK